MTALRRSAILALAACCVSCGTTQPVADYDTVMAQYARQIDKQVGGDPTWSFVPTYLFQYPIGTVLVNDGRVPQGTCPTPKPAAVAIVAQPPADSEGNFSLSAQVPSSLTRGWASLGVQVSAKDVVTLSFDQMQGAYLDNQAMSAVLADPACKTIIGAQSVTIIRGQITAEESFAWQKGTSGAFSGSIVPGGGAAGGGSGGGVAFAISASGGPAQPFTIKETSPQVHFFIVETYRAVPLLGAAPGLAAAPRPSVALQKIPTPAATIAALSAQR